MRVGFRDKAKGEMEDLDFWKEWFLIKMVGDCQAVGCQS